MNDYNNENSAGTNTNNYQSNNDISSTPDILQMYSTTMSNNYKNQTQIDNSNNINKMSLESLLAPEPAKKTLPQMPTDEELLKIFIGKNYEKITKRPFNFAGFFFTNFYLFYRKMFGFGIIIFLLNVAIATIFDKFYLTLILNVIVGFLVNKVYLLSAKKKIAMIKVSNKNNGEELKKVCGIRGGTSIGKILLGIVTELILGIIILFTMVFLGLGNDFVKQFNLDKLPKIITDRLPIGANTLLEDVSVNGYGCINSKCNVNIVTAAGKTENYLLDTSNNELFNKLGDYKDYIKLNIYYVIKGETKIIADYKMYLKSTNKEITDVKTENELRDKIGLYSVGTHTDTFTLIEVGATGFVSNDNDAYMYTNYKFTDSKGTEYEMKYINDDNSLNLVEGNNYTITFEVAEDTFGYEFTIKSIK